MSEHPAASVNWTFSRDGLPIGVQLVGQRFDDLGVLRLSRLIEELRPAQRPYPEPPGTRTDRAPADARTDRARADGPGSAPGAPVIGTNRNR